MLETSLCQARRKYWIFIPLAAKYKKKLGKYSISFVLGQRAAIAMDPKICAYVGRANARYLVPTAITEYYFEDRWLSLQCPKE